MSLNADVMDDIDGGAVIDGDIVKEPSEIKPNTKPVTIVAKTEDVAQDITELSEAEKQTLPAMDVSFNVVKDNVNKVIELQDVENDILAQESINRSNATLVNEVFPGLLGQSIRLEEFTHSPSKTNFLYVKKHMRNKISTEELSVINNFNDFLSKPLQDARAVLQKLSSDYIEAAVNRFTLLFYQFKELEAKLKVNKNTVVSCKGEFVNLVNVDLFNICYNDIELNVPNKCLYDEASANIKQLMSNRSFKSFILGSVEGKPAAVCLTADSMLEYAEKSITILDLCKVFGSLSVTDNIQNLKAIVDENIVTIDEISSGYLGDAPTNEFSTVNDFLIKNNSKVQALIASVQDICKIVLGINNLALNAEPLLDLYNKL